MTRAAEFCYIAETASDGMGTGQFIMGLSQNYPGQPPQWWTTTDAMQAMRISEQGCKFIATIDSRIGFRKVLAG